MVEPFKSAEYLPIADETEKTTLNACVMVMILTESPAALTWLASAYCTTTALLLKLFLVVTIA